MFIIVTSFIIIVLDQVSKYLIVSNYYLGESTPIVPNIFHITYVTNTGIAFGLFKGFNFLILFLAFLMFFVVIIKRNAIINYYRHEKRFLLFRLGIAFLIGGAIGNIIDRIVRGKVIDFLDFRVWPVFNIADSFISIAIFLFFVHTLKPRKD